MSDEVITTPVLRRMVHERVQAFQRGELPRDYLRGYATAMFHAGVIQFDELQALLSEGDLPFALTPPSGSGQSDLDV
jgi:hypothetical protein